MSQKAFRIPQDYKKQVHRSVKDWSEPRKTTFHAGEIIPIYSRRVMAGSKVIIDPYTLLASQPLVSKLLDSFKLQVAVFFDSDTNYYGWLDNNRKNSTQDLLSKTRHRYDFLSQFSIPSTGLSLNDTKRYVTGQYNNFRGSLLEYMGVPSGICPPEFDSDNPASFSTLDLGFVLTYLNIFRNYYMSKQEDIFPYIVNIQNGGSTLAEFGTGTASELDDLFMYLRSSQDGVDFTDYDSGSGTSATDWLVEYLNELRNPHGGILMTTYLPDLFRNLLSDTYNTARSQVAVENGHFNIDTLRFQNKLQRLIDRFDVSGGRFSDWLRTVWGVNTRKDMDIPELIGVSQTIINPNQVVAQSAGEDSPLGDFGGNFNEYSSHRKHSFFASTPGRVMVCVTLVPMVNYSQGLDIELTRTNFADDYYPEFEQLGYQKVPGFVYNPNVCFRWTQPLNGGEPTSGATVLNYGVGLGSVGKQVAWLDMQTGYGKVFGEFGNGGRYKSWVLRRNYKHQTNISGTVSESVDITHYVNPLDYQYPFSLQSLNDPNWELQTYFDIKAVLPMGKRFMPNLE